MMKRKFLTIALVLVLVFTLSITCFAENLVEDSVETSPTEDWASEVLKVIENHQNGDVTIIYTDDSVLQSGILTGSEVDLLTKQVLFTIEPNLPAGYVIYDDPNTDYIDGIRLNGNTVTSYKVPIDYTQDVDFTLIVKVVYAEGFTGALAQISDGTFDWTKLLENPIGLLMALYYILSTISVAVGIVMLWTGKNKKVKTSNDISKSVTEAAQAAASKLIEEQVLPVVSAFQNTAQGLVKAFALTTSKSKEAPLALLDVLQNISNMDAAAVIDQAKALIAEDRASAEAARQQTIDNLKNIAQTIQEVTSNGTRQTKDTEEDIAIF